jgi:proteasome assembly chaperone (PAC2) family protein
MEKKRKISAEELAARQKRHEEIMRRLKAMIEKYERIVAERRAS